MKMERCPHCRYQLDFNNLHWTLFPMFDEQGEWTGKGKCIVHVTCTVCHAKVNLKSQEVVPENDDWRISCEKFFQSVLPLYKEEAQL